LKIESWKALLGMEKQ